MPPCDIKEDGSVWGERRIKPGRQRKFALVERRLEGNANGSCWKHPRSLGYYEGFQETGTETIGTTDAG